jgi:hypothetical protein
MNKNKLLFTVAVLFTGAFSALFWLQNSSAGSPNSAQNFPSPTPAKRFRPDRELKNASRLESLLKPEGVAVNDENLIASPSAESEILRVNLTAKDFGGETNSSDPAAIQAEISLLSKKANRFGVSRMRALELSPELILIASLDEQKRLIWWTTAPDPRLFRAETADENGNLSGETKLLKSAEMIFSVPKNERISEIRFYHPQWDGGVYSLELIGALNLNSR